MRWYNDSKGTNLGAALAAIQGFDGPLILIAGGRGKGADFRQLAEGMDDRVKAVVLLGEDRRGRVCCGHVPHLHRWVPRPRPPARPLVAHLPLQSLPRDAVARQPRRRARLESTELQPQLLQRQRQRVPGNADIRLL